jgi:hypothetical protein
MESPNGSDDIDDIMEDIIDLKMNTKMKIIYYQQIDTI